MEPGIVPTGLAALRRCRLAGIAVQPLPDVIVIVLLRPQHAGEGLPLHAADVFVRDVALHVGVIGIRLGRALPEDVIEIGEEFRVRRPAAEPQAYRGAAPAGHVEA
jgi:hypothetical protein